MRLDRSGPVRRAGTDQSAAAYVVGGGRTGQRATADRSTDGPVGTLALVLLPTLDGAGELVPCAVLGYRWRVVTVDGWTEAEAEDGTARELRARYRVALVQVDGEAAPLEVAAERVRPLPRVRSMRNSQESGAFRPQINQSVKVSRNVHVQRSA